MNSKALGGMFKMPGTESSISTGGQGEEEAIPGSEVENLADAGPAEMGRLEQTLIGTEVPIIAQ